MGSYQSRTKRQIGRRFVVIPETGIISPVIPLANSYLRPHGIEVKVGSDPVHGLRHRDPIPTVTRDHVWIRYHGDGAFGTCYCCGIRIQRYQAGWHCSHVKAVAKNGETTVENLRTCCRHCNLSMGDQNLYVYIKEKGLTGPGARNVDRYLALHSSQIGDRRDNNWGKIRKVTPLTGHRDNKR